MEKERSRAVDAERRAVAADEKVAKLQSSLDDEKRALADHKAQLTKAQAHVVELDAARAKVAAQAEAGVASRTQAEGRAKQAEAHALELQRRLEQAGAQLAATQGELAALKEAGDRRTREVQKLRSEVASLKRSATSLEEAMEVFAGTEGSLEKTLAALMDAEGQKAAVLADANGIVIAAVGDPALKEGMAATSQLVGSMCTQLVDMVPFSSVRAFLLQDTQSNVIAGRSFVCSGESVGLATYGARVPADRVMDGAMANLSAALE
jgi:multidrug efflux pump subunit AcrA (membrane-fusion protein)